MQHAKDYVLAATVSQAADLIRTADKETDKEILQKIDRVLNIQAVFDNPTKDGISLFWDKKFVKQTYSNEDYKEYIFSLIKLSLKHPENLFINRYKTFISSVFPDYYYINLIDNQTICYIFDKEQGTKETDMFFRNSNFVLNKPVSNELRNNIIQIIGCKSHPKLFLFVWNAFIPLCFVVLFFIYAIIKHKTPEIIVILCILLKQLIVILSQPTAFFEYYLAVYIIGYIIFFYYISFLISKTSVNYDNI